MGKKKLNRDLALKVLEVVEAMILPDPTPAPEPTPEPLPDADIPKKADAAMSELIRPAMKKRGG